MIKRILSSAVALIIAAGIIPFSAMNVSAASKGYNISDAIKYASKNWNNGRGLCAEFASECLQAGGIDVYHQTVKPLYDALKDEYGKSYKLKLTGGTSGSIKMADNEGKLEKGDPIFYKCNYCKAFEHVVICNGANEDGYAQDYAHNNAHNGKKQTYTYRHCNGESWTLYSIRMESSPKLYGEKNSVGVPEITSVANGANGIVIKWSKVESADRYKLYRKTDGGKFAYVASVNSEKYTDKSAKNGIEYTYTVRAVEGDEVSRYYGGESVQCLSAPKLVSVANRASSIKFEWNKVSSADGYIVYRKKDDGSWKKLATLKGKAKDEYIDSDIKAGASYAYTVKAYDGCIKGAYSGEGKKIVFLKAPGKLNAKSADSGILFTYSAVKGATGYKIFRKTAGEDKWTTIAKVQGGDVTEYIDTDVESNVKYIYTVKAMNGSSLSQYEKDGAACKYKYIETVSLDDGGSKK